MTQVMREAAGGTPAPLESVRAGLRAAGRRLRAWTRLAAARCEAAHAGLLFDLGDLRRRPRRLNEATIRRLCVNAYLGDASALCRVLGRYKMFVDTGDIGLSTHLLIDGYWEMWVTEAMLGFVRAPMVVVDVGANLGYYTLLLADLVGPGGRVHAFEPNPRIMQRLAHSVAVNSFGSRTTLHAAPLAGHAGERVRLIVPDGEPKNAHILAEEHAAGAGVPLLTTTIDDVIGDGPVDFIKIDAEGAELAIWHGMRRLLDRRRPLTIFLEFTSARYADPAGFLAEIRAQGFAMAAIDPLAGVVPVDEATVLAGPRHEDWMLVLAR